MNRLTAVGALIISLGMAESRADFVSEFGMGYKMPATTSAVLLPECHVADLRPAMYEVPNYTRTDTPCGGDNPAFIGWPIAWERSFNDGVLRVRAGWFHYSNWFDGGRDRETHMDLAAVTVTINWSALKRRK